jgi:hypothetical protein
MRVSLLSSGWDQVVPRRYGRQGRGGSSAQERQLHILLKRRITKNGDPILP